MFGSDIVEMHRFNCGQRQVIVGHLSKIEIKQLKTEGYRLSEPIKNKHGIMVSQKGIKRHGTNSRKRKVRT